MKQRRIRGTGIVAAFAATVLLCQPCVTQAKSLQDELTYLLETHPRLKAARKNISAAKEGIREAQSGYYPTVDVSGDFGREYVDSPGRRNVVGEDFHDVTQGTSLTITQNIFEGFRTSSLTRIAKLEKQVSSENYRIAEQGVLFDGIRAYINVLKQSKLLDIAKQNEQTLLDQLNLESARVERGSGLAVDVLQAKSRLQLARERVVTILGKLRQAQSLYYEIFDRPAAPAQMTLPALPNEALPETMEGALDITTEESSILKRSEKDVDIASERRTVEQATYWPRIDLVGEGSWEKNVDGVAGVRREGRVTVRAAWDLFDGFLTPARTARASALYGAALDTRLDTDRDVRDRVRRSWTEFKTTAEQRDLLENAVNIAAEVLEARQRLRQSGRESAINVLDAERELNNARLRYNAALYNHVISAYRLLLQTGQLSPEILNLKT